MPIIQVISLNITIIDINDNAPTFEQPEYHLRIPETAEPGTSFELPVARDADPTPQYGVTVAFCRSYWHRCSLTTKLCTLLTVTRVPDRRVRHNSHRQLDENRRIGRANRASVIIFRGLLELAGHLIV